MPEGKKWVRMWVVGRVNLKTLFWLTVMVMMMVWGEALGQWLPEEEVGDLRIEEEPVNRLGVDEREVPIEMRMMMLGEDLLIEGGPVKGRDVEEE